MTLNPIINDLNYLNYKPLSFVLNLRCDSMMNLKFIFKLWSSTAIHMDIGHAKFGSKR